MNHLVLGDAVLRSVQWFVFATAVVLAGVSLKAAFGRLPYGLPRLLLPRQRSSRGGPPSPKSSDARPETAAHAETDG